MAVSRISEAQSHLFLADRANSLQVQLQTLQEQVATGRRLFRPDDDPLAAARVVRINSGLAAIDQYTEASRFGQDVLSAQDDWLGHAHELMVRAEEIATQYANGIISADERLVAAEEVHGLLQEMTTIANAQIAGRYLFAELAEGTAPYGDPDSTGYDPANAFDAATYIPDLTDPPQGFYVQIGGETGERVRVTTPPRVSGTPPVVTTTFTNALVALQALEDELASSTPDIPGTLAGLAQGRSDIDTERASVGARAAQLIGRQTQLTSLKGREQELRSRLQDADSISVISQLVQTQTALQAVLQVGSQLLQTSLSNLIRL